MYSPAAHNVPVLTQKGNSKLAFNYSFNAANNRVKDSVPVVAKARGYDLQAAYAFTNHWAAQLNYFYRTERNAGDFDAGNKDSVVINYKRHLTEIGAGYFHALNNNRQAMFQVFVGAGTGTFSFTDDGRDYNAGYRSRYHNMRIVKFFIQPAFMLRSKNNFTTSISSRHSFIYFKKINTNNNTTELSNYKLDSLSYSPKIFWEPSIVNTFGYKKIPGVQLEFQAGFAFLLSRRFVDARSFNFSAGLLFDLPKVFANSPHSSKN